MIKSIQGKMFFTLVLFLACIVLFVADTATGPADIGVLKILQIVFHQHGEGTERIIVLGIRIPAALMAVVVGASLSLAGCLLQTILNNPMASPYSLGISSAAGFGAAITIVFSFGLSFVEKGISIALNALLFSLVASGVVYALSSWKQASPEAFILIGIAVLFTFQSLLSAVEYYSSPEDLQGITFWLFGSLSKATYPKIAIIFSALLVSFCFAMRNAWVLTSIRLGEARAEALGINLKYFRLKIFFVVSILTSVAVCFVGIIGFIGIIAPHISRLIVGEDHRILLPNSAFLGAIILLSSSIISKVILPGAVFPIGIVTAVAGIPMFLFIILFNRKTRLWH